MSPTKKTIKKDISIRDKESNKLSKEQSLFLLRLRMATQCLRALIPVYIKRNSDELRENRVIRFSIASVEYHLEQMLLQNGLQPLSLDEWQTAVNCVLTDSKCPIMDWGSAPYIDITMKDAKRITTYVSSLTPLVNEKQMLGLTDSDEDFQDIL